MGRTLEGLFWLIRFPATVVFAVLLAIAFPIWFGFALAMGVVVFVIGIVGIPFALVKHAWTGDPQGFRSYLRGLVDWDDYISDWWDPYTKRWKELGDWQETGR